LQYPETLTKFEYPVKHLTKQFMLAGPFALPENSYAAISLVAKETPNPSLIVNYTKTGHNSSGQILQPNQFYLSP